MSGAVASPLLGHPKGWFTKGNGSTCTAPTCSQQTTGSNCGCWNQFFYPQALQNQKEGEVSEHPYRSP